LPLLFVYAGVALLVGVGILLISSYLGMTASLARSYMDHMSKDSYIEQLSKDNAVLSSLNRANEKRLERLTKSWLNWKRIWRILIRSVARSQKL